MCHECSREEGYSRALQSVSHRRRGGGGGEEEEEAEEEEGEEEKEAGEEEAGEEEEEAGEKEVEEEEGGEEEKKNKERVQGKMLYQRNPKVKLSLRGLLVIGTADQVKQRMLKIKTSPGAEDVSILGLSPLPGYTKMKFFWRVEDNIKEAVVPCDGVPRRLRDNKIEVGRSISSWKGLLLCVVCVCVVFFLYRTALCVNGMRLRVNGVFEGEWDVFEGEWDVFESD
jgi:hypothetical protein